MVHKRWSWTYGCLFGIALGMLLISGGEGVAQEKSAAKKEAAKVNDVVISQDELDAALKRVENQMVAMGHPASVGQMPEIKNQVLQNLIDRELLYQDSQKQGIQTEEAEIDEQVNALKARFPGDKEYRAALQRLNLSEQDLRAQFGREISVQRLIDLKVAAKVSVSEPEIKAFYDSNPDLFKSPEMVRARHILVKVEPKGSDADKAQARGKMEQIAARIKKGEDFAAVAKETSDCPSGARGGDLDFFKRGQMVPQFEAAAFSLREGEISEIVETQFGFHVIQVTGKKPASVASLEETKEKIGQHLKQEKTDQQVSRYVTQLKSDANIQVFAQ
ncbi:MAG TPA: peptidylprolyl isomerase [Syntrophobacteraceae bacterium]|nr:peptidylprolyl isomerase [Syntrophobacteraceae bacterium]